MTHARSKWEGMARSMPYREAHGGPRANRIKAMKKPAAKRALELRLAGRLERNIVLEVAHGAASGLLRGLRRRHRGTGAAALLGARLVIGTAAAFATSQHLHGV